MSDQQEKYFKGNELAFPFIGSAGAQEYGSGLTKFELAVIHFLSASVTANDHATTYWMTEDTARAHARSAVMLAKCMFEIIGDNK